MRERPQVAGAVKMLGGLPPGLLSVVGAEQRVALGSDRASATASSAWRTSSPLKPHKSRHCGQRLTSLATL